MALISAMSGTCPYRPTGMMALVRGVILASMPAASILQVSASMSAYTGLAPSSTMTSAVATKVKGVVMISSPAFTPNAISAISRASVPLATVMQWRAPVKSARRCSSSLTSGPMMYWPWSRTAWMRPFTDSRSDAYCVFRSMKSSGFRVWGAFIAGFRFRTIAGLAHHPAAGSGRRFEGSGPRRRPLGAARAVRRNGSSSPLGGPARPASGRSRVHRG